jgi:hypothetical protein
MILTLPLLVSRGTTKKATAALSPPWPVYPEAVPGRQPTASTNENPVYGAFIHMSHSTAQQHTLQRHERSNGRAAPTRRRRTIRRVLKPRSLAYIDWDQALAEDRDAEYSDCSEPKSAPSASSAGRAHGAGEQKSSRSPVAGDRCPEARTESVKQIAASLNRLVSLNQCVALWIKDAKDGIQARTLHRTGYFTDMEALAREALQHSGKATGCYYTINPINPKALDAKTKERGWNRVSPYIHSPDNSVVIHRRQLLVDIDPVKPTDVPTDVSATEGEKQAAITKARQVEDFLKKLGWPEPMVIDSGNGVQLIFKIKLPSDSPLVRQVLAVLHNRFTDDTAIIDKAVSAAKQLGRLPGTMNCKGPNTKERPHRMACIISTPAKMKLVCRELLEKTGIKEVQAPPTPASMPDLEHAEKYIDKMEPAVQGKTGSLAALKAARAIVVGFNVPWDSQEAWELLKRFNTRCQPPWNLDDSVECHDLRRKLQETHDYAIAHHTDFGYLCEPGPRHYDPLPGRIFPLIVPDYAWMGHDTPSLAVDDPPVRYAYGLRLLWAWTVRHKDFLIPDILLKSAHWGGKPPKHWREHYKAAMKATAQRCKDLKRPNKCDETCVLHGSKRRHKHYRLAQETCGVFEDFAIYDGEYVFEDQQWRDYRNDGKVYLGYWPGLIFGMSKPIGWTPRQVKLLSAITRELTRVPWHPTGRRKPNGKLIWARGTSDRPDRAQILHGNQVHDSADQGDMIACPLLDKQQEYVAFCGNLRRRHGKGYRLRAWAERAGYDPKTEGHLLLEDFAVLAEFLDLVVVGRHHHTRKWLSLENMKDNFGTRWGRGVVFNSMIRVYAPSDFLTLWRYRFAQRMGFSWIFGGADIPFPFETRVLGHVNNPAELDAWIKAHGFTYHKFAEKAKMSRSTLYRGIHRRSTNTTKFWENVNRAIESCVT